MIDRLKWMLEQLQKLEDNERVRSEGLADYRAVKNELIDVIATYTAPVAPPPAIVNTVFGPGELDALKNGIAAGLRTMVRGDINDAVAVLGAGTVDAVNAAISTIRTEVEQSDVVVLAAIAETRAELLAAA